jgi:lipopolysaccharide export system ATP-binding protein
MGRHPVIDDTALLEVEDLVKSYGGRRVVDGIGIRVAPREIVGLLGPNGAGKTTAFRTILGLVRPDQGRIQFNQQNVSLLPVYRRARLGMGYLAQDPSAFRGLTVAQNLLAVLEWMPGLRKEDREDTCDQLLERFHLEARRDQRAAHLSGGEQRRLEIARVLARRPTLMLLDEPFANIDPRTVEELQEILATLRNDGMGVLITDHNVRETLTVTNRSYIIVDGRIFQHGSARQLVEDETVRRTYLGERFELPKGLWP